MGFISLNMQGMDRLKRILGQVAPEPEMPELTIENIEQYPQYKDQFIQYATKNFSALDPVIIYKLIIGFRADAAKQFVAPLANNFSYYAHKNQDPNRLNRFRNIFQEIINTYPAAAKVFVEPAVKDFPLIDSFILQYILDKYPQAAIAFAKPAIEHFQIISPLIIRNILRNDAIKYLPAHLPIIKGFIKAAQKHASSTRLNFLVTMYQGIDSSVPERKLLKEAICSQIDPQYSDICGMMLNEFSSSQIEVFLRIVQKQALPGDLFSLASFYKYGVSDAFKKSLEAFICSQVSQIDPRAVGACGVMLNNYPLELMKTFLRIVQKQNLPDDLRDLMNLVQYKYVEISESDKKILKDFLCPQIRLELPKTVKEFNAFFEKSRNRESVFWCYPEARENPIVQYAIENFSKIEPSILHRLVFENGVAQAFVEPAVKYFQSTESYVIFGIMEEYPAAAQAFLEPAIKNFKSKQYIATMIVEKHPEAVQAYVEAAIKNFKLISPDALRFIMDKFQATIPILVEGALKNISSDQLQPGVLALIFQYANDDDRKRLKNAMSLIPVEKPKTLEKFIASIQSGKFQSIFIPEEWKKNPSQTQTRPHFIKYIDAISSCLADVPENIKLLALTIYKKEQEERKKGNYVFYHAQNWDRHLSADIYRQLWNIINPDNMASDDFTFFRFKRSTQVIDNRKDYLFMNQAMFGNITELETVACTFFQYFLANKSVYIVLFPMQDIFKEFGKELLYEKYKSDLQKLNELHKNANISKSGNIMLIAVPVDKLSYVRPVHPGGHPRTVEINGIKTSDTKTILDVLIRDPNIINKPDKIEFALPLTTEYALDPKHGPRAYSFNVADTEKMKVYLDARDRLFTQIKADIEANRVQQQEVGKVAIQEQMRAKL